MCNVLGLLFENWSESCPVLSLFRGGNHTLHQDPDSAPGSAIEPRLPASDPHWQWSSYNKFRDESGRTKKVKRPDENIGSDHSPDDPFEVVYYSGVHIAKPDVVKVSVSSSSLVGILRQHLPDHGGLKSHTKPKVPGRDLYMLLPLLKHDASEARKKSSWGDRVINSELAPEDESNRANGEIHLETLGEGQVNEPRTVQKDSSEILYLEHLLRFLEGEYKDVLKSEQRMRDEKRVAWDMLWIFLSKKTKVGYYCEVSGQLLCAKVADAYYTYLSSCGWSFKIILDVWDFNGTAYKSCRISRSIPEFHQETHFSELPVCPIEILGDSRSLDKELLANGKTFYELAAKSSSRFMLYEGPMYQIRKIGGEWQLHKEKGSGRVMIDLRGFSMMNPNYPMGGARPPTKLSPGSRMLETLQPAHINRDDGSSSAQTKEIVPDGTLIYAPAIVYGFSFKLKKWGCFSVSQFSGVQFDREAFRELTMDKETKDLVYKLVSQYTSDDDPNKKSMKRVDPIAGKGEGCILLCHGPPGTGKTLTAESIAEKLGRPLWAMGTTEMGTTLKALEAMLVTVFEIATRWNAVLLFDEADVFVEKRSSGADVVRNAMTGVFLRQLEYYRGVVFLTTNRIDTFDDAFRSRVSLFLHYPELGLAEKTNIWKTLLGRVSGRVEMEGVSDEFWAELAAENLNGREIRNVVHTAQVYASSSNEILAAKHVKYVARVCLKSIKTLNHILEKGN